MTRAANARSKLDLLLAADHLGVAIGAHDAISAVLIERTGFDAVYLGSYATEAAFLGNPDLALMSKSDRITIARHVSKAVACPVIADAEEGWGSAISVIDTVRDFEAAGVAAIHLDDEALPSHCPFIPGVPSASLISVDEMCGKIEAAVDAREDENFKIIARSDVIGTCDSETYRRKNMRAVAAERLNRYLEAGASAAFVMALNEDDLNYFRAEIDGPLIGIFATAEPLSIQAFRDANYDLVIGSLVSIYASLRGIVDALVELKRTENWNEIQHLLVDDEEFFEILGLEKFAEMYSRYRIE